MQLLNINQIGTWYTPLLEQTLHDRIGSVGNGNAPCLNPTTQLILEWSPPDPLSGTEPRRSTEPMIKAHGDWGLAPPTYRTTIHDNQA